MKTMGICLLKGMNRLLGRDKLSFWKAHRTMGCLLTTGLLLMQTACMPYSVPGDTPQSGVPVEAVPSGVTSIAVAMPMQVAEPLAQVLTQLATEYEKQTGVAVQLGFGVASRQERLAELIVGEADRSIYLLPTEELEGFARQGLLTDLTEPVGEWEVGFLSSAEDGCRWNGARWGVPYLGYASSLGYSPALLEESGCAGPPADWEALEQACAAVQAATDMAGLAGVAGSNSDCAELALDFVASAGGRLITGGEEERGDRPQISADTQPVRDALSYYARLLTNYATEESEQNDLDRAAQEFLLGRAAFFFATPAHLAALQKSGKSLGCAAFPAGEAGGQATLHALCFAVPQAIPPEECAAALSWVRWLQQPEQLDRVVRVQHSRFSGTLEALNRNALLFPLIEGAEALSFFKEQPLFRPVLLSMRAAGPPRMGKRWTQLAENAFLPALRRLLLEENTLDACIAEVMEQGAAILLN